MMQHIRRYLSWFLLTATLAAALATTGCYPRYRHNDRHHRRHYRVQVVQPAPHGYHR